MDTICACLKDGVMLCVLIDYTDIRLILVLPLPPPPIKFRYIKFSGFAVLFFAVQKNNFVIDILYGKLSIINLS